MLLPEPILSLAQLQLLVASKGMVLRPLTPSANPLMFSQPSLYSSLLGVQPLAVQQQPNSQAVATSESDLAARDNNPDSQAALLSKYKQTNVQADVMAEWNQARQAVGEDLYAFMSRVQNLSEKAFLGFPDSRTQEMAVCAFCRGMLDDRAAQLVMLHAKKQVDKAVRTAVSLVNRTKLPFVPTTPLPAPPPARQIHAARNQANLVVDGEPQDDPLDRDYSLDGDHYLDDEYGDHVEHTNSEYHDYHQEEVEQEDIHPNREIAGGRPQYRERSRGRY